MPVQIGPLPPPNGDRRPWLVSYPPFPAPQNAASQAPLPNAPWSSPAVPSLNWPANQAPNLTPINLPLVAQPGMPLRSHANQPAHVSTAVAAYQDALAADIRFRYSLLEQAKVAFVHEQAKEMLQLGPRMGAVQGNDAVRNAPDYLPNAPAQHRGLNETGLDRYRCYDKYPGPYDNTVQYIRRARGRQAIRNQADACYRQLQLLTPAWRASLAQGVATGAPVTWG